MVSTCVSQVLHCLHTNVAQWRLLNTPQIQMQTRSPPGRKICLHATLIRTGYLVNLVGVHSWQKRKSDPTYKAMRKTAYIIMAFKRETIFSIQPQIAHSKPQNFNSFQPPKGSFKTNRDLVGCHLLPLSHVPVRLELPWHLHWQNKLMTVTADVRTEFAARSHQLRNIWYRQSIELIPVHVLNHYFTTLTGRC